MEESGQHHIVADLSPGDNPGTYWIGGRMRPGVCLDVYGERKKKKKSVTPTGIRTPDRPTRSLVTVPTIQGNS